MTATLNINDILLKVKKMDKEDQLTLLERLVALIKKNETASPPATLSNISGIGSGIWKKTDIDEYVDGERQW